MEDLKRARAVMVSLLRGGAPEYGARLKQRMNQEYLRLGLEKFDQRACGYPKFADFLDANADLLVVEKSTGPGDLRVSLRPGASLDQADPLSTSATGPRTRRIRNDIWQAFTNPDPERRRFFHLPTTVVRHYLRDDQNSSARRLVEDSPDEHVEIPVISGEEHIDWMRSYLDALDLPEQERIPLTRMLDGTYSSKLNAAFTGALGDQSVGWRRRRTTHVLERVLGWAKAHHIPEHVLEVRADGKPSGGQVQGPVPNRRDRTGRERLQALIDLLPDSDVDEVVLPFVLSVLWTSSRRR